MDKFGSPLFFPDAGKKVEDLGKIIKLRFLLSFICHSGEGRNLGNN